MDLLHSVRDNVRRMVQLSKEQRQHRHITPQPVKVPNRDPKVWGRVEQAESPFWTLPSSCELLSFPWHSAGRSSILTYDYVHPFLKRAPVGAIQAMGATRH